MNFASALFSLKRGFRIKRKDWIGYWQLEDDKVMIHCKDGKVINLADSDDIVFTLENAACDDWEVITNIDNVGLPYNPEVKKKDSLTIPVDKFYPKIGIDGNTWWKYQPTCYDKEFCLFDGNKWNPHKLTEKEESSVDLNNYKLCYKYKGEWVPWNRIELEIAKDKVPGMATVASELESIGLLTEVNKIKSDNLFHGITDAATGKPVDYSITKKTEATIKDTIISPSYITSPGLGTSGTIYPSTNDKPVIIKATPGKATINSPASQISTTPTGTYISVKDLNK